MKKAKIFAKNIENMKIMFLKNTRFEVTSSDIFKFKSHHPIKTCLSSLKMWPDCSSLKNKTKFQNDLISLILVIVFSQNQIFSEEYKCKTDLEYSHKLTHDMNFLYNSQLFVLFKQLQNCRNFQNFFIPSTLVFFSPNWNFSVSYKC